MYFKKYLNYIKNNPKKLWFKSRWYGWGWVPATWQGWVVISIFILIIILNSFLFDFLISEGNLPESKAGLIYTILQIITVLILIIICYLKGEKPGWRWGEPTK